MAAEFDLLDHLKPFTDIFCRSCLGLRRKRQRQSVERDLDRDDREHDLWERQGLLDEDESTSSVNAVRERLFADDEDAMSLHSNIGSRPPHRPDMNLHTYPHFPLHTLTRWQLLVSWFKIRGNVSPQLVTLPAAEEPEQDPDTTTDTSTFEGIPNCDQTDDEERNDMVRLEQAVVQARLSARKKRLRQAKAETMVARERTAEEDVDWGPMQRANNTTRRHNVSQSAFQPSEQVITALQLDWPESNTDRDDFDGVPDLADEGGLFSLSAARITHKGSSSSSGLSAGSLSSSGTSAAGRKKTREKSRRALSDVTQEDSLFCKRKCL